MQNTKLMWTGAALAMGLGWIFVLYVLLVTPAGAPVVSPEQPVGQIEPIPVETPVDEPAPVQVDTADVRVVSPLANSVITSPLKISGEARGSYFFEASFPIALLDANGREIARVIATAQGEWMTTDFVPFTATLPFTTDTATGTLVFENDNPSGLPENAKIFAVPVRFR